jgi:hypothetical protein
LRYHRREESRARPQVKHAKGRIFGKGNYIERRPVKFIKGRHELRPVAIINRCALVE